MGKKLRIQSLLTVERYYTWRVESRCSKAEKINVESLRIKMDEKYTTRKMTISNI